MAPAAARWWRPPPAAVHAAIICYHSVGDDADRTAVRLDAFRAHMNFLKDGYAPVTLDALAAMMGGEASGNQGRTAVAVTFDDGYRSVIEHALPTLVELQIPATAFTLPGLWGGYRNWEPPNAQPPPALWRLQDARTWLDAGMSVGSHGLTHRDLTKLDEDELREETEGSRAALEEQLGPVSAFSYPWGRAGPREQAAVAAAGYTCAVTTLVGAFQDSESVFSLKRIMMHPDDEVGDLEMKISGAYDWIGDLRNLRRRRRTEA